MLDIGYFFSDMDIDMIIEYEPEQLNFSKPSVVRMVSHSISSQVFNCGLNQLNQFDSHLVALSFDSLH